MVSKGGGTVAANACENKPRSLTRASALPTKKPPAAGSSRGFCFVGEEGQG
jgi:hypothetical protein